MSAAIALWLTAAVLLCWFLGAYNRLVRLRAQVIGTFAPLDQRLGQAMAQLPYGPAQSDQPAQEDGTERATSAQEHAYWAGLSAAGAQLEHALRIARKQPLDANAVAALKTAYATVQAVWQRRQGDPNATWPAMAPVPNQRAWEDNMQVVRAAMDDFNQSVTAYNAAIRQFPALLLAYLFSFGPATCL